MDSTETLLEGELSWKLVGKLPLAVYGIRVANINNVIYAFGNLNFFINPIMAGGEHLMLPLQKNSFCSS